jgi:hypothetical protein
MSVFNSQVQQFALRGGGGNELAANKVCCYKKLILECFHAMRLMIFFLLLGFCTNAFAQNHDPFSVGISGGAASSTQNSSVASSKTSFAFGLNLRYYPIEPLGFGFMVFSSEPNETVRSNSGLVSFNYRLSHFNFNLMLGLQELLDDNAKVEFIEVDGPWKERTYGFNYGLGMSYGLFLPFSFNDKSDLAVSPGVYYLRGIGPAFHQLYFLVELTLLWRNREIP